MAGDILLYQTDIVPIGDDQRQHLELTRDVAERFNSRFGETFTLPERRLSRGRARGSWTCRSREEDVDDGRHRQGTVCILDAPDVIRKKFKTAVTDSGREVRHDRGQAGHLEPDRDHVRRDGRVDRRGRGRVRRRRATGRSRRTSARPSSRSLEPIQERYHELRADESRAPAPARARRREGARGVAARRSRRCTSAWASSDSR